MQDAGFFYACLRFSEASCALQACLQLRIVDVLASNGPFNVSLLENRFGFTAQGARTLAHLLRAMGVLEGSLETLRITGLALEALSEDSEFSRLPYLSMGSNAQALELLSMLRGEFSHEFTLYGDAKTASLMESNSTQLEAKQVAKGLASRAKCFASTLAKALRQSLNDLGVQTRILRMADLGAGSTYVARACLEEFPELEEFLVVDRAAALRIAEEMDRELPDSPKLRFLECDIFHGVPAADIYVLSNTVHDWLPNSCDQLFQNIRNAAESPSMIVVHEPVMLESFETVEQRLQALWMSSYALTLFKLTGGQGTCYTVGEHDQMLARHGFTRVLEPISTLDGCSTLLYRSN